MRMWINGIFLEPFKVLGIIIFYKHISKTGKRNDLSLSAIQLSPNFGIVKNPNWNQNQKELFKDRDKIIDPRIRPRNSVQCALDLRQ